MSYVGNPLATAFAPRVKQDLTGQSGTSFTLSHAVSSANDLSVYINHVRQEPTTAYTVDYTTLTTTGNVASTDDFYIIFDELALQSIAHDEFTAMKATSGTFTGAITTTQMASSGPVSGTTGTFSGAVSGTTGTFSGDVDISKLLTINNQTSNEMVTTFQGTSGKVHIGAFGHILQQNTSHSTTNFWGTATRNSGNFDIGYGTATSNGVVATSGNVISITNAGVTSFAGNVNVTGNIEPTGSVRVDDGQYFQAGNSYDLQMYHDGTNSYVEDQGTGDLRIKGSVVRVLSDQINLSNAANNADMITAVAGGAVNLRHNGSSSLTTTSNGVSVDGTTDTDKLTVTGTGADYIATFQNATSATGYGVLIKEPLNASAGYPLLAVTDGQANTVRFRVDSSTGHIGIGRAPTTNDTVHILDTTPRIKLEESSSGGSKMLVLGVETDGTPFIDAPQSGGNIEFKCVGVPAMQITRTGDTNNPAEFRLKAGSGSMHQCITGTNWGYSTGYEAFMFGRDDTASEGTFSFNYNPRINSNGGFTGDGREVIFRRGMIFRTPNSANNGWYTQFTMTDGVTSGDFNDTSDEKLKKNIKDINGGLSVINKLRPVNFDWKDEGKGNGLGGFIAQEVQKILPNDVMGEEYVAPDREKDIKETEGLSINSTSIIAHLVKAVQELEAKVKALESK